MFSVTTGVYGVFDGHGGDFASRVAAMSMTTLLRDREDPTPEQVYREVDDTVLEYTRRLGRKDGSTAVVVEVNSTHVRVSNAGDSRCIVSVNQSARAMSDDHKGSHRGEVARIEALGGTVQRGRVGGILAVTRALGDGYLKASNRSMRERDWVISTPYVQVLERAGVDFVVLFSDGVSDVLDDKKVHGIVHSWWVQAQHLPGERPFLAQEAARHLVTQAIESKSTDNVTAMVLFV